MYYRLLINGNELGVFGHEDVQNLHLSVSGGPDQMYVFASAVCDEGDKQFHYDWIQEKLGPSDTVEMIPVFEGTAPEPRKKFVMGRPRHVPSEDRMCDFCQRLETEVDRLIYIDEHRPSICSDCVELCSKLLKPSA
jgi:hypothetical protein